MSTASADFLKKVTLVIDDGDVDKIKALREEFLTKGFEVDVRDTKHTIFKRSEEEQRKRKRKYRQEYSRRPDVVAKRRKRNSTPEAKARRAAYNSREDVIQRKKDLAKLRRKITSILERDEYDLYKKLRSKAQEECNLSSKKPLNVKFNLTEEKESSETSDEEDSLL